MTSASDFSHELRENLFSMSMEAASPKQILKATPLFAALN